MGNLPKSQDERIQDANQFELPFDGDPPSSTPDPQQRTGRLTSPLSRPATSGQRQITAPLRQQQRRLLPAEYRHDITHRNPLRMLAFL